jgi:hypothetical protein
MVKFGKKEIHFQFRTDHFMVGKLFAVIGSDRRLSELRLGSHDTTDLSFPRANAISFRFNPCCTITQIVYPCSTVKCFIFLTFLRGRDQSKALYSIRAKGKSSFFSFVLKNNFPLLFISPEKVALIT